MACYVLDFEEIYQTQVTMVGGKGAHLGELSRMEGVRVPSGFCVTTDAFDRAVANGPSLEVPEDVVDAIERSLAEFGEGALYAVRSSATAEDTLTASFAGQYDSYLNVAGPEAVVEHVRRCWQSLFAERAVAYRLQQGIDERAVRMAVVVQRMVDAEAAGVLFTADPLSGNRRISSIEAAPGLGEDLVSGLVTPDIYRISGDEVIDRTITTSAPTLSDAQALRLAQLGRRIEAHFGEPQDIEWCLTGDEFYIVQSRPITTLFPIPPADDEENHIFLSVGHQQMMTDAMKPLGLSFWQLTASRPMHVAGGRLFVDVSRELASPTKRAGFMGMVGRSDPLIGDALRTLIDRGFIPTITEEAPAAGPAIDPPPPIATDPAIPARLIERSQASISTLERKMSTRSGAEILDLILEDIPEMKAILFDPVSTQVIVAGTEATWWLNEKLEEWLGEKNAADTLSQSVDNNITSKMGLALIDVADAIRPYPQVVAFLEDVDDDDFLDRMIDLHGGREARDAIQGYLDRYGMRCAGEIDITRPRWSENPTALVPIILSHVVNLAPGAADRRFERGKQEAMRKEAQLLDRLRDLLDGTEKVEETKRMIDRLRTFVGYREYPKYSMISRYFVYKKALLREAERLLRAGVITDVKDIFYLTFQELHEVVRTEDADGALIRERKEEFERCRSLTPPRVLTSDGEAINGEYRRSDLPDGALIGLPVSAGVIEGRARVILDMAAAEVDPGDILITTFTDPSWTPLFVAISGLVTEIGGLMTHGAVIAREYGLPAVVGVANATQLVRDGQRIRVNGTDGVVEILG